MLNHNLGGSGRDFRNLTPINRSANASMSARIEEKAKADLDDGFIIKEYKVTASYGQGKVDKSNFSNIKSRTIETEEKTPNIIKYKYEAIKKAENSSVVKRFEGEIKNELKINEGNYLES
ncbi:hypothetical protein [Sphingobacterium litopenaei]|uniref:Uncharacterized protein n=1 Tax=Sphingobacterium litopenaei TaxID=2763500 RepID=A0ABR7Y9M2_9SPHI|nr:hypothetical protein [Sphingobacterium litopenaei]MBD1428000.1 hypothetical protein [Sphingobacterium litopenaei]